MLKNQEVCNFLTENLNNSVLGQDYQFIIHSEVGKNENNLIQGIMRVVKNDHLPIANINNTDFNAIVEFLTPANCSNKTLEKIEKIISSFKEKWNGKEIEFSDGKGLITFTSALTDYFKTEYGVGNTVPLRMYLKITYTENMVTSATKVWKIRPFCNENAEFLTIPYLSESVYLEKGGKTNNISDALFQQTLLTSQIKYYRFEIPYETNDTLCSMLQKDILTGDFNKKYELQYYDGVSFTESNPFTTVVSIFRSGDTSSRRPEIANFNITFSDVDDGNNIIKYKMALIDNPFDTLSENTQYFPNQTEQQAYYQTLIDIGADFDDIPAPNLNSLNITNQIYLNTRKYDVFDLINKNYAIIKATKEVNNVEIYNYYFYYRANNGEIGANGQVSYNLTLDTLQTYLFNDKLKIDGSFIVKSHLDRWIYNEDGTTVTFNGKADSKLFEREEIKEVAKRLVHRSKLKFDTTGLNLPEIASQEDSVFNIEKTPVWVYIFIDAQYEYSGGSQIKYVFRNVGQDGGTLPQISLDRMTSDYIETPTAVIAYPLETDLYLGKIMGGNAISGYEFAKLYSNQKAFLGLAQLNPTLFSHIKTIKISIKPPLNVNEVYYNGNVKLNGYNSANPVIECHGYFDYTGIILGKKALPTNFLITTEPKTVTINGVEDVRQDALLYILEDNLTTFDMKLENYEVLPQITFNKNDISNGLKNKNTNPKLNNSDYKELALNIVGSQHALDYQKLNNSEPKFTYLEPLTCDTTRVIVRYKSNDNEAVFNEYYSESFNGLIYTSDLSLPIANDVFSQYLANNKNAYLSFQNQQQFAIDRTALGMGKQAIDTILDPTKAITSGIGGVETFANLQMQLSYNKTQFDLSMDNMKSAPSILVNANGSALFANSVSKYGVYIELYEGLDTELEMANDIMYRDGYNYNRFDDLRSQLNIRRYFNYVKAVIGSLSGIPMSEESRKDFKQRFINGVRFWNKNEENQFVIDYTKENYENRLND